MRVSPILIALYLVSATWTLGHADIVHDKCHPISPDEVECQRVEPGCISDVGVGFCEDGEFLLCVVPEESVCDGVDDDCDGTVDEGSLTESCYSGPPETRKVGFCRDGERACGSSDACEGERLPSVESSGCNFIDDDCDGKVDEEASGPSCPFLTEATCAGQVLGHSNTLRYKFLTSEDELLTPVRRRMRISCQVVFETPSICPPPFDTPEDLIDGSPDVGGVDPPDDGGGFPLSGSPPGEGPGKTPPGLDGKEHPTGGPDPMPAFAGGGGGCGEEDPDPGFPGQPEPVEAVTDADGSFEITVDLTDITRPKEQFVSVVATCRRSDCGNEVTTVAALTLEDALALDLENAGRVAHKGHMARLVTAAVEAEDPDKRNDLPLVVLEYFDPTNDLSTDDLIYFLAGQPKILSEFNGVVCDPRLDPRGGTCIMRPCREDPNSVPDIGTSRDDHTDCIAAPEGYRTTASLRPLVLAGYDLWLVDINDGGADPLEIAQELPVLFGDISRFNAPEFPPPGTPPRSVAVLGMSTSGLLARIALNLWGHAELPDDEDVLCKPAIPPLAPGGGGGGVPLPPICNPPMEDVVKVLLTFDTPHERGIRIPVAMQSFLQDQSIREAVVNAQPKLAFVGLMQTLLGPKLIQDFVLPHDRCEEDGNCDFGPIPIVPLESDTVMFTRNDLFYQALSSGPDEAVRGYPSVPTYALANGGLDEAPSYPDGELLRLLLTAEFCPDFPIEFCTDVGAPDFFLADSPAQAAGSTLDVLDFLHGRAGEGSGNIPFLGGEVNVFFVFLEFMRRPFPAGIDPFFLSPTRNALEQQDASGPQFLATANAFASIPASPLIPASLDACFAPECRDSRFDDIWFEDANKGHFHIGCGQTRFIDAWVNEYMAGDGDGVPFCALPDKCTDPLIDEFSPLPTVGRKLDLCDCCDTVLNTETGIVETISDGTIAGCDVATAASIFPGAVEIGGDGIDQNCDGLDIPIDPDQLPEAAGGLAGELGGGADDADVACIYGLQESAGPAVAAGVCPVLTAVNDPLQGQPCAGAGLIDELGLTFTDIDQAMAGVTSAGLDVDSTTTTTYLVLWSSATAAGPGETYDIMGKFDDSAADVGWSLQVDSLGGIATVADAVAGSAAVSTTQQYDDGQLHVFAVVVDGTAQTLQLVTEQETTSSVSLSGFTDTATSTPFTLGQFTDGGRSNGQICYVAVLDATVTQSQVENLASLINGVTPVEPGPASFVLGQPDFVSGTPGAGTSAINAPTNVAYDGQSDRLFVADQNNHRVLVFDLSGGINNGMAATFALGQPDLVTTTANTQCGGGASGSTNACGMNRPFSVDFDNGRLFVADFLNSRVLVYDLTGGITNGMPASFVIGQPDFTTTGTNTLCGGGPGPAAINACGFSFIADASLACVDDRLFVVDNGNRRITTFDLSAGITNGMAASFVFGQPGFTTGTDNLDCDGVTSLPAGSASACGFRQVLRVHADPSADRLLVSDALNHRVLFFDLSAGITNFMAATNVLGQPDLLTGVQNNACGGGGSPGINECGLRNPAGAFFDPTTDRVYVPTLNNRVLVFDLAAGLSNGMAASAVFGQPNFTSGGGSTTDSTFAGPSALTLDVAGQRLFVVDLNNHRLLVFE